MQHPGQGWRQRSAFEVALNEFEKARARAALQEMLARFRGQPVNLLSYDEVAQRLQVTGRSESGRRAIPIEAIVGSVGRYADFTRTFLPRQAADAQRWARVRAAGDVSELPPIVVYQIGDAYFILDGNHRVSIARRQGHSHIDAEVIEVNTRVPFSADDDPDALIVKGEYAQFLAETKIDELIPCVDLRVSAAGQIGRLQNHIEVHRYFLEEAEQRDVPDSEAVVRWYEDSYAPLVEAVRERGLLRYFPGRTEADFYVWIATHQARLGHEFGWQMTPESAVNVLARGYPQALEAGRGGWREALKRGVQQLTPLKSQDDARSWSQQRVLARYSGALFGDVLLFYEAGSQSALPQSLALAAREGSRLYAICVSAAAAQEDTAIERAFLDHCQEAGVQGQFSHLPQPSVAAIGRRALLADLLVVDAAFQQEDEGRPGAVVCQLVEQVQRPLLLVNGEPSEMRRVLLVYDGSERAREALFVATYMAEMWRARLIVAILRRHFWQQLTGHVQKYLALHEVGATFEEVRGAAPQAIARLAQAHQCDLIVTPISRPARRPKRNRVTTQALLQETKKPLFIL
jgi:nucleotide-binding universal stress UspA family protein